MQSLYEHTDNLSSPFEAFICTLTPNKAPIKSHWHYFVELIYVLDGHCTMHADKTAYALAKGDTLLFHPHVIHSIYPDTQTDTRYVVIKFDIASLRMNNSYTPKFSQIFRSAAQSKHTCCYFPKGTLNDIPLCENFSNCVTECEEKDYGYDIKIQGYISNILIEFIRYWRKQGFDADIAGKVSDSTYTMNTILEYIDEHSNEQLLIEKLASMCNMSYSYFAKSFHELYGQSCKSYIDFVRISKIKDLLLFTNYDLTYISQETGFADCSHLIRTFKKREGITPKQFRMKYSK